MDLCALLHILPNDRLKDSLGAIFDDGGTDSLATFEHAHHNRLAAGVATVFLVAGFAILVHVPRFAADEGFVDLNFPTELAARLFVLHGETDAMEHEPCGLLRDADGAMQFPEEIPLRLLPIIHTAGTHLSRPKGESSRIVPSLMLNWALGCRVLHWNMRREAMKPTSLEPHVGQTTPLGQRFAER